jgi:hypothetical protein
MHTHISHSDLEIITGRVKALFFSSHTQPFHVELLGGGERGDENNEEERIG